MRATYLIVENDGDSQPAKMLISVSKKRFKRAVKRNLLKRRIREAYRHQKPSFYDELNRLNVHIILSVNYITQEELDYQAISKGMEKLLSKVIKGVQSRPKNE